jgi:RNA recognition motif-containing protein
MASVMQIATDPAVAPPTSIRKGTTMNNNMSSSNAPPTHASTASTESGSAHKMNELNASSCVWVVNVSDTVSEQEFCALFEQYGKVQSARILRSTKCAFVTFESVADAVTAVQKLQGEKLDGLHIVLNLGQASRHLWVGNVSAHVTEQLLSDAFARFGHIESATVLHQEKCAFVTFVKESSAMDAAEDMNGALLGGMQIVVNFQWPAAPHQQHEERKNNHGTKPRVAPLRISDGEDAGSNDDNNSDGSSSNSTTVIHGSTNLHNHDIKDADVAEHSQYDGSTHHHPRSYSDSYSMVMPPFVGHVPMSPAQMQSPIYWAPTHMSHPQSPVPVIHHSASTTSSFDMTTAPPPMPSGMTPTMTNEHIFSPQTPTSTPTFAPVPTPPTPPQQPLSVQHSFRHVTARDLEYCYPTTQLFVGNIGTDPPLSRDQIAHLFLPYGHIVDIRTFEPPKGYAFVEFSDIGSAMLARYQMMQMAPVVNCRKLIVNFGKSPGTSNSSDRRSFDIPVAAKAARNTRRNKKKKLKKKLKRLRRVMATAGTTDVSDASVTSVTSDAKGPATSPRVDKVSRSTARRAVRRQRNARRKANIASSDNTNGIGASNTVSNISDSSPAGTKLIPCPHDNQVASDTDIESHE